MDKIDKIQTFFLDFFPLNIENSKVYFFYPDPHWNSPRYILVEVMDKITNELCWSSLTKNLGLTLFFGLDTDIFLLKQLTEIFLFKQLIIYAFMTALFPWMRDAKIKQRSVV